jgi:hypothetical protein
METLRTLREQVLDWLDESGDTGTTKKLVDHAINKSHVNRLTMSNWPFMKWGPLTFSLVKNQREYALHQEFLRPYYFRNKTKSGVYLIEVPDRDLTQTQIDWNQAIDGRHFRFAGRGQVQAQPSSASVITISSSSVSDVGSTKKITIYGESTDGMTSEDINPNGTSDVAGLTQFTKILGVTKASAWSGTMTMTSNAGAVTNLKLLPTEFGRNYQNIHLLYLPSTTDVIEYDFYRKPRKLSADNDVPDTPYPYSLIHVWDSLLDLSAYDGRVDSGRLSIWAKNQNELEIQMRQEFLEGRSLGARPRHVRDVIGDWDE